MENKKNLSEKIKEIIKNYRSEINLVDLNENSMILHKYSHGPEVVKFPCTVENQGKLYHEYPDGLIDELNNFYSENKMYFDDLKIKIRLLDDGDMPILKKLQKDEIGEKIMQFIEAYSSSIDPVCRVGSWIPSEYIESIVLKLYVERFTPAQSHIINYFINNSKNLTVIYTDTAIAVIQRNSKNWENYLSVYVFNINLSEYDKTKRIIFGGMETFFENSYEYEYLMSDEYIVKFCHTPSQKVKNIFMGYEESHKEEEGSNFWETQISLGNLWFNKNFTELFGVVSTSINHMSSGTNHKYITLSVFSD